MGHEVHVLPMATINEMKSHYQSALTATPPGAVFRAKTTAAVITAYKSGKVLFQGSAPEIEAGKWHTSSSTPSQTTGKSTNQRQKKTQFTPDTSLFTSSHIGSDEAGTGDYFGPITVAAAYVNKSQIATLKEIGVKDSKNLTDPIISKLAKDIVKLQIPYSLLVLHNEKYNRLQKKGWSQGKMKAMLHHHAITNLLNKIGKVELDGILIDQFCEPAVYSRHIGTEKQQLPDKTYFITKAESHSIAVATASIIARASFVREMDKLSDAIGMNLPKGASAKVDQTIAKVIQANGAAILDKYAKTHFANTKKAQKYL
ncbi:ribonuclease HIII [Oceanobacillus polygoni]|uniref:Ribonuclease HIII n=1 Tax=Oceanobacillus polygoni TaxID=1235259 RepID=A0A9X0YU97_9BACI|nr:ribonuclease HIII [Oceanobacillus polygoni]MBP2077390.1 ribonuclease HIII [Oceanobacillus polygoni]